MDKYYFTDFRTFERAQSVNAANEIQRGVTLDAVFGDPGHHVATQVLKDGIYGYRLYGNVSYFGVADLTVDTTVFCSSTEGNTSKFNSPGWVGGFGCTENIDETLFPTRNSNINSGQGRVTFEVPATSGATVQQASTTVTSSSMPANVAASDTSASALQLLTLGGISAAGVAGVFGIRSMRQHRRLKDL